MKKLTDQAKILKTETPIANPLDTDVKYKFPTSNNSSDFDREIENGYEEDQENGCRGQDSDSDREFSNKKRQNIFTIS